MSACIRPLLRRTLLGVLLSFALLTAAHSVAVAQGDVPSLRLMELPDGSMVFVDREDEAVGFLTEKESTSEILAATPRQLPGWPLQLGEVDSTPTVGDVDGDGSLDVVFATEDGELYLVGTDGTPHAGWPHSLPGISVATPSLADIDDDGRLEIFVGTWGMVLGLRHDGTPLPGWPQHGSYAFAEVAIDDLDQDGTWELAASDSGHAYVWEETGALEAGWPYLFATPFDGANHGPAVGDVDADGILEIGLGIGGVFHLYLFEPDATLRLGFPGVYEFGLAQGVAMADVEGDGSHELWFYDYSSAWVVDANGNSLPGWPVSSRRSNSPPTIGDIDGDGRPEMVWATGGGDAQVFAVNDDGTYVDGWPVVVPRFTFNAQATLGDIDGDGGVDVVLGGFTASFSATGRVYAWHADGTEVQGYPFSVPGGKSILWSAVTITDLDQDGDVDLLVGTGTGIGGTSDGRVFAFDLDTPYDPSTMEWPTKGHDMRNTSRYEPPPLPPGFVDDTDRLDEPLGPDPFPVVDTIDITEAATRFDVCDFSCSGGPELCCGADAPAWAEPALIFTMSLIGAGSEPQLVDAEYEVHIDFGEERLRDHTEEPGLLSKDPKKGTADVKLKLDLKEKKKKKKGGKKGKSPFKGLAGIEWLSQVDQTAGTIDFVIPVSELQAKADDDQAAASGLDRYPSEPFHFLLWFRTKKKLHDFPAAERGLDLIDRAPNTNDNLAPTIASEALEFTVSFAAVQARCGPRDVPPGFLRTSPVHGTEGNSGIADLIGCGTGGAAPRKKSSNVQDEPTAAHRWRP